MSQLIFSSNTLYNIVILRNVGMDTSLYKNRGRYFGIVFVVVVRCAMRDVAFGEKRMFLKMQSHFRNTDIDFTYTSTIFVNDH